MTQSPEYGPLVFSAVDLANNIVVKKKGGSGGYVKEKQNLKCILQIL